MENGNFLIPLNGLKAGQNEFFWRAGEEFFESFGNEEILDASLELEVVAQKVGGCVEVDCEVQGSVTVSCDRCLADLDIPVDLEIRLSVRHEGQQEADDEEREVITVAADETQFDMAQVVYDYVCLSLPLRRVHPDGECDPEVAGRLGDPEDEVDEEVDADPATDEDNPFAKLKSLIDN